MQMSYVHATHPSMADHFGRYPTFVVTNAVLFVSGVVTPFCTDFYRDGQKDDH